MSHDIEKDQQAIPSSTELQTGEITPVRRGLSRRGLLGIIAGGAAAATAIGFGINLSAEANKNPNIPVATSGASGMPESNTPTPTTVSSAETQKSVEANQSFDQFIESFAIKKDSTPSFEGAANHYTSNYQNWLNAGLTEQYDVTLIASDNQKSIANVENKFDTAITSNIYIDNKNTQTIIQGTESDMRSKVIDQFIVSLKVGGKEKLAMKCKVNKFVLITSDASDITKATSFTANVEINITDNGTASGLAPYRAQLGGAANTNLTAFEQVNFTLDQATQNWKVSGMNLYAPTIDKSSN
jgi:hypothetical protein